MILLTYKNNAFKDKTMENNFSVEEIKNSVEYQWRKHNIKILLILWLILAIATLFIPVLLIMGNGNYTFEFLGLGLLIWGACVVGYGLLFGEFILFYYLKNRYLLKNFKSFKLYEVVLDTFSTSYAYKGSIYYTVKISDEEITKTVDTNPYFSNLLFSKFTPNDFNNKKVVGLYDNQEDKFYIIKKVN